jgi:NTE family protein
LSSRAPARDHAAVTGSALVLGGGGVTGVAWEIGMLAGLAELGVDLTTADLLVGTSAGAVVAAQVGTGADLEGALRRPAGRPTGVRRPARPVTMARWGLAVLGARDPQKVRARFGALALRSRTVPESERIAVIAGRLPVHEWPERALRIHRRRRATPASYSCSTRNAGVRWWRPSRRAARCPGSGRRSAPGGAGRLIDGGMRSPANADLGRGRERVVVLGPDDRRLLPGTSVAGQVAALRAAARGSPSRARTPPPARGIGRNVPDPASRARRGARRARPRPRTAAGELGALWAGVAGFRPRPPGTAREC